MLEMREWLAEMSQLVAKHSANSQQKQKQHYDRSAKCRSFEVGDQVFALLPTAANKLKLRWTGPYKVSKKVSPVDYEVEMPGKRHEKKVYHVNLMKKWHVMTPHPQAALLTTGSELQDEITSAENPEEWVGSSTEQFFLAKDGGCNTGSARTSKGTTTVNSSIFPQSISKYPR